MSSGASYSTETGTLIPPFYDTFSDWPAVNGYYVDPYFGTRALRMTDAASNDPVSPGSTGFMPEYSENSAINIDDTYAVLTSGAGNMILFSLASGIPTYVRTISGISFSNHPRWSRTYPERFYYYSGSQVRYYDADADSNSLVHEFSGDGYSTVTWGGNQGDVSDNERMLVLLDGNDIAFFDLDADNLFGVLDADGVSINSFDAITGSKDGDRFTISWNVNGTDRGEGQEEYEYVTSGTAAAPTYAGHLQNKTAHLGMGRGADGVQELWAFGDTSIGANKMVHLTLDGNQTRTQILEIPWGVARHFSCASSGGWCYVSTYVQTDKIPGWDTPTEESQPSTALDDTDWHPYQAEIFRINKAGDVQRIMHTRSENPDNYWDQPHFSVSPFGNYGIFGTNMGDKTNLVDSYLIDLTESPPIETQVLIPRFRFGPGRGPYPALYSY